jgi:hypothetical protein
MYVYKEPIDSKRISPIKKTKGAIG